VAEAGRGSAVDPTGTTGLRDRLAGQADDAVRILLAAVVTPRGLAHFRRGFVEAMRADRG
jgi:hypothetical protein